MYEECQSSITNIPWILNKITQSKHLCIALFFYLQIYNVNKIDRLVNYGEFTNNTVPNNPDGDDFELNKKC